MSQDYKQLTNTTDQNNVGLAIQMLIKDNLKNINTCFIAKIQSINGNKVSIKKAIKDKQTDKETIYNNCLIGFNKSGDWQTQFKLKVGDIGLALVSQDDLTSYKNTGEMGLSQTGRTQDRNDSIFIPLSLFGSLINDDINFLIESFDKKCKLEFNNDNIGILQAEEVIINTFNNLAKISLKQDGLIEFQSTLLSLKSENTTLKTKLSELAEILDNALILQSPSGVQPFDSTTRANFTSWKNSLDDLFKD